MRKYFVALIIFALIISFLFQGASVAASGLSSDPASKMTPELLARLNAMQPGEIVTVIVTLRDQTNLSIQGLQNRPDRQQVVLQTAQARAHASQRAISAILDARRDQGQVARVVPFWVFNGLSVTATKDIILELAARDDVASLAPDEIDLQPAAPLTAASAEPNLALINAPALWGMGYSGQGVVVANMDTGVDISHPELAARWRGGSNSWFDPYGQHPATPVDISGHGTWTMGVMVAGDASGTSVGVAPQAQWIAVKIFNDSGAGTATAIHQGFQWLLDPDQNPSTADAPQVVNNSWSYGGPSCRLDFQNDLRTLRAAGILPVFAAGNYGPGAATSVSPGNYPEAFAVGGINNNNLIFSGSSRGPSACGEPATTYPELVAPAVSIKTTDRYGLYTTASGTSLSAPQAAGALALLLSAFPDISADAQAAALLNSAVDLGAAGPDNSFGYGRLDVLGAYNWLAGGGQIPPTATPVPSATVTSLPNPTLTPTAIPSATPTSLPSVTATPVPSVTATALPTSTATPLPSATATALPTSTATPLPSPTPTALSTSTPTALPSATPTSLPSATPSPQPSATPGFAILFGDGFESGNLNAWSAVVTDGGRLGVSPQAALIGLQGMSALISSPNPIYAVDNSPTAENAYHARFYFSPNSATIPKGMVHDLLAGNNASGMAIFRIQIQGVTGGYQVRGLVLTAGNRTLSTGWYPLNNASQSIEIAWSAATTQNGTDGTLTLWLDGVQKEVRSNLANGSYRLESVQLGPQNIGAGISGTEYFDQFASSRGVYIGP